MDENGERARVYIACVQTRYSQVVGYLVVEVVVCSRNGYRRPARGPQTIAHAQ